LHPLLTLIGRRLLAGIVTLFVVSVLVFLATSVLPGNAAHAILGHEVTPDRLRDLEHQLGLDRGAVDRFWHWLSALLTGNLGSSLANGRPVWIEVQPVLVNSIVLTMVSGLVGAALGVVLGAVAALRQNSWFDRASSVVALAVPGVPIFVFAIALILVFATGLMRVLPAVSYWPPGPFAWQHPRFLILPALTLVIVVVPYIQRMMRAATIEALESEYVEMARLKGVPSSRVLFAHALPNAIAPTVQVIGLNFLFLVAGGMVVVEFIFNFPGVGRALVQAVTARDVPVIQFIVIVLATFYVVVNILTDVIALLATPRRRAPR
jgi:peptide/nickel transport system permease protein